MFLLKELQSLGLAVDLEGNKIRSVDAENVIASATEEEAVDLGTDELLVGDESNEAVVDLADDKGKDDFEVLAEAELQKEIESEEV